MADSEPDQADLPRTPENARVTHGNATVSDSAIQINGHTVGTFKNNTAPNCSVQIDSRGTTNFIFNISQFGETPSCQPSPTPRDVQAQAPLPGSLPLHENAAPTPSGSQERLQSRSQPSLNEHIELLDLDSPAENQQAGQQRQELAYPRGRGRRSRCYIILTVLASIVILVAAVATPVAVTVVRHKYQHQQSASAQISGVTSSQDPSQATTPSIPSMPSMPSTPWTSSNTSSQTIQSTDTASGSSTLRNPSSNTSRTTSIIPIEALPTSDSTSSYITHSISPSTTSSTSTSLAISHAPAVTASSSSSKATSTTKAVFCTTDSDCPNPLQCNYSASTCDVCTYATLGMRCSGGLLYCCDPLRCISGTCVNSF